MPYFLCIAMRLALAGVLGGIIGYERENTRRPAGFRTHILVCVGAALVMVTSEYIFEQYHSSVNMDPARLGAQVISGIGFLGAGTIIRDGFNVKGLTTAASLWAVSCVGIAAGIGFYGGAVIATVIIYLTLLLLKKFEKSIPRLKRYKVIFVQSENRGWIEEISDILGRYDAVIKNIEFVQEDDKDRALTKITARFTDKTISSNAIDDLQKMEGVTRVYVNK